MSRRQMTVARTGMASPVVQWAGAALGIVAVAVGAYFVADEVSDGGSSAAVTQEAQPVSFANEDAIVRFSNATLRDQDAILRTATSATPGDVREQDAILRAATSTSAGDVRDQDAILRVAVPTRPGDVREQDAILRAAVPTSPDDVREQDAILRYQDPTLGEQDAIQRLGVQTPAAEFDARDQDSILRLNATAGGDREQDAIFRLASQ